MVAETANATEATDEALPAAEIGEEMRVRRLPTLSQASQSGGGVGGQSPMFDAKPTIYVGNLFFDVTETDLVKEFARFGTVSRCKVVRDSRGLSKGYVYSCDLD